MKIETILPIRSSLATLACISLALFLVACGGSTPTEEVAPEEPAPAEEAPTSEKSAPAAEKPAPAPEKAETVNVSLFSWPGYGFWFVAKEKGFDQQLGIDLNISIIEDPYESFALMAAGRLDTISSTIEYGPIGAKEGLPARVVSIANTTYGSDKIIVAPGIESAQDLKGEKVAVMEGGLSQIYMAIFLEKNGLKFDDVEYVNLIMDDAAGAMIGGTTAAGEFWEPFGGQVLENLKGSRIIDQTFDPFWLKTSLLSDAVFMSDEFIESKPEVAVATLKAYYMAVDYWMKNTEEANKIIAEGLKFPIEDVQGVIGTEGHFVEGGLYVYSLEEAGAFLGVAEGTPPLEQTNGQINELMSLINDWWIKFGFVDEKYPIESMVNTDVLSKVLEPIPKP